MSHFPFSLVYVTLCTVYLVVGVSRRGLWQKAFLKCLPIASLLTLVIWTSQNDSEVVQRQQYQTGKSLRLLMLGLSLSCTGDGLLVFRGTLGLFGVLSFAVAQCVYISLFGLTVERVVQLSFLGLFSGLVVLCLSLAILLVFSWRFNEILKNGEHGMRRRFIGLIMPMALVYFVLISLMLWSAVLQLQQNITPVNILGAVGGFMFYVSDVLIAAGAIWQLRVLLHGRVLVMCTYYGAQLLITLSVIAD